MSVNSSPTVGKTQHKRISTIGLQQTEKSYTAKKVGAGEDAVKEISAGKDVKKRNPLTLLVIKTGSSPYRKQYGIFAKD